MVKDMTKGSVSKVLIIFAIPILLGGVLQQLSHVINAIIIGQNVGARELGAIGATQSTMFLFQSLVIGFNTGVAVITSQYFGAKNEQKTKDSIYTGLILIVILCIISCLIGVFSARTIMSLINTPAELIEPALVYFRTMLVGGIFVGLLFGYSSLIRSLGDSFTPLIFSSFAAIIDLVLTIIFVTVFHLSVFGSALASVLSMVIAVILMFIYINKKKDMLTLHLKEVKISLDICKKMIRLGLPAAIQFTIFSFGNIILQAIINGFGYNVVTGYAAALSICMLVYQPSFAMGTAVSTFVGQNKGAENNTRIKQGFIAAVKIITLINIILSIIVFIFGPNLLNHFVASHEVEIIRIGSQYLRTVSIFYLFIGLMFTIRETLRGVGDVISPMFMGILDIVIRVVAAIILARLFLYPGVWFAQPISWLISTFVGMIVYLRGKWQNQSAIK